MNKNTLKMWCFEQFSERVEGSLAFRNNLKLSCPNIVDSLQILNEMFKKDDTKFLEYLICSGINNIKFFKNCIDSAIT